MKTLILSKENLELSLTEALTIIKPKKYKLEENRLTLNTKKDLTRLAQTKKIYENNKLIHETSFKDRVPEKRPAKHPATIQPKLARTLINLTGIKENQTLLDPFCGTGSILIEASLLKLKPIGVDIDKNMIERAKTNLKYFKQKAKLIQADATKIKIKADAIATDPPFGRSTTVQKNLYKDFLNNAKTILKKDGIMVITFPKKIKITNYKVIKIIPSRINRSLTRYIYILKNQ